MRIFAEFPSTPQTHDITSKKFQAWKFLDFLIEPSRLSALEVLNNSLAPSVERLMTGENQTTVVLRSLIKVCFFSFSPATASGDLDKKANF